MKKLLFPLILMLSSVSQAQTAPLCGQVFESSPAENLSVFLDRLPPAHTKLARLFRALRSGLAERSLRTHEAQLLIKTIEAQPRSPGASEGVFEAFGLSVRLRRYIHADRISFHIPSVFTKKENGGVLAANASPPGLDTAFSKLIAVILQVAAQESARSPNIKRIEISAETVLNQRLVIMFKEMGFEKREAMQQPDAWAMDPFMGMGMHMPMQWRGARWPVDPSTSSRTWGPGHSDHGRTWLLKLDLAP